MIPRVILSLQPPALRKRVEQFLEGPDVVMRSFTIRKDSLLRNLARNSGDLFIVSRRLIPEPVEAILSAVQNLPESPLIVILTEQEDPKDHATLVAAGCHAVLHTGVEDELLGEALRALLQRRKEEFPLTQSLVPDPEDPRLTDFDSQNPKMQAFMDTVRKVVPTSTTLLFTGETGVGKERLARAVHLEGPRSQGPFISVNCGAIPDTLLESELFGHEEGAFTGATRSRRGWVELSHSGTLFLDEIGEMPQHLQVKLLRILQTREVQRVGGESYIAIDVRIMAATNRDLSAEVEAGRFRSDLYYRLSVVTLEIPPLRERPEDIAELADRYIAHFQANFASPVERIHPDALQALQRYAWPGNIRELINIIERAMLLCYESEIRLAELPVAVQMTATGV